VAGFPERVPGVLYLTEGGQETEVMYRHGFELPEFALFPLLERDDAMALLRALYIRYLDTAARHGFGALVGGLDYRASPDWAGRIGYSPAALADAQRRSIDFLREVSDPYRSRLPDVRVAGIVGPRGDAYQINRTITVEESEEYHSTQLATLVDCGVDLVEALTFGNVDEAVGLARAAATAGLPLSISFALDRSHRLNTGVTLREAVVAVDAATGDARPAFYGINCSHPFEFLPAIEPGEWFRRVRCLRPNASSADKIALCSLGHLEQGDPVQLGRLMGDVATRHEHIDVWGGCCGTWDTHLEQIAARVRAAHDPAAPGIDVVAPGRPDHVG
jgi:S-methylmethionine-dependent homocysteine/selenocysteine methylase